MNTPANRDRAYTYVAHIIIRHAYSVYDRASTILFELRHAAYENHTSI
jgi:hypothetical protein